MARPLKVAILGGGWFGNFHLDNLLRMDGVEVAALVTGNAARLAEMAKKAPEAHLYAEQDALFSQEAALDALIVCVPPDSHRDIELEAAKRKINLYLEKPLGVSLAQVRRCEQAIAESNILCSVGYQTRYNPHLDELRRFLSDKKAGTVVAKWMGVMPQTPWWRIKERSGGQLHEQVTHMIDVLRYLFGEIRSVYSTGRTGLITDVPNYNVEDCSASVLTFENGLLATVTCGCFVDGEREKSEIRFEIYTDCGSASYEWDTLAHWGDRQQEQTVRFGNEFHYPALQAFLDAVRFGDASLIRSPYADAAKTFAATWAANRSMETHKEILLREL